MARGYPDFEGDKAGLYLKPEWASKEGLRKSLRVTAENKGYGESFSTTYTVPAGKELRINLVTGWALAANAVDADKNQGFEVWIIVSLVYVLIVAGNFGLAAPLSAPLIFDAGDVLTYSGICYANHDCYLGFTLSGYEVSV